MNKRSKQLKKFLRDRKLLTRFKLNTQTRRTPFSFGVDAHSIRDSFVWSRTPEGVEFWHDLNREFGEYITVEKVKENSLYIK